MNCRIIFILTSMIFSLELLLCPATAQAGQYSSSEYHYQLTIPDKWMEIPKNILNETKQKVVSDSNNTKNEIIFDSAFQKNNQIVQTSYFSYPYAVVQILNTGQPSEDGLREMAGSNSNYSESDHSILTTQTLNIPAVGEVIMMQKAFAGKEGAVVINYYCLKNNLSNDQRYFEEIVNSFKYDNGFEYQDKTNKSSQGDVAAKTMSWIIIIGIIIVAKAIFGGKTKDSNKSE